MDSWILEYLSAEWPGFKELRSAASALGQRDRLRNAISILVNDVRVAMAGAFLTAARRPSSGAAGPLTAADSARIDADVERARHMHTCARMLLTDGLRPLVTAWHFSDAQVGLVREQFSRVVGSPSAEDAATPRPLPVPVSGPRPEQRPFEHAVHLFLAAVGQGMAFEQALHTFGYLDVGAYSADDRCFYPDAPGLGPISDRVSELQTASRLVIRGAEGEHDWTIFVVAGRAAAVVAERCIRIRWDAETRRATGGLETLPDFIALPRDEQGRPIIPRTRVTALVEAQQAWESELGTLDAVTATIVAGKLVMPKVALPSQQTFLRNHPSWEKDPKAKEALGPVIAKWLATGVLEYVAWNDRMPVLLQPCGAVPKGTAPFYRLITDARFANEMYSDWGVSYTTASQLSSTLNRCDFTFSVDISDAYHLSLWAGCGGELRAVRRPVLSTRLDGAERLTWIDALVNGCTPSSCHGGCDKDMSGIMIDGHIFRFASCQFGQKTAGSPLGSIVRSVARYFARLQSPVHVAAWVDDLIFIMSTPEHGACEGFAGGCRVCAEYHGRALEVQRFWKEKAAKLRIPLSEKGHEVSQTGSFTGLAIDTFRGVFSMLPDKLASTTAAVDDMRAASHTTPRLAARVRGKVLHYGVAVPFIAVAAACISQLMHKREAGLGPLEEIPHTLDEPAMHFDWEESIAISARARRALDFVARVLRERGTAGQPIWPIVPSSLYHAFTEGKLRDLRVLVISYDASVAGWGAIIRVSADTEGYAVAGGFREALSLLGADFLLPLDRVSSPVAQVHREGLACLLAARTASQLFPLSQFTVLIRGDCVGALRAMRKGSFRSPTLQDMAMRFQELFLDAGADPPLFLHAPGEVMKAEGVDGLSRAGARELRASESTQLLRCLVDEEACRHGERITLDVFASGDNAVVPRFFARHAEPSAEGVDAFAQPSWAVSLCPACGRRHREFPLIFPPRALLHATVAKLRADGVRGVVIAPYALSDPAWPALMGASITRVANQRDTCHILPATAIQRYVSDTSELGGAQRLAVFAVDFGRQRPGTFAAPDVAPPCGREREARPRPLLQGSVGQEDRRRIAAILEQRGVTAREGKRPTTSPPPIGGQRRRH